MSSQWKAKAGVALAALIRVEQFISVGLLALILVSMGTQVISRYLLRAPLSWSEEVSRFAMIWLTFIAASFISARGQHIAVDLFGAGTDASGDAATGSHTSGRTPVSAGRSRFSTGRSAIAGALRAPRLVQALTLLTTLWLLCGGFRFVWRVYPVGSPSVGISMTYWYGAASVGMALMSLHAAADLLGIRAAGDSQTASSSDSQSQGLSE
jgi:TRAP-type C4-dicarboxylate transport system permease small subunit